MSTKGFKEYVQLETIAGIILMIATVLALVVDNSPVRHLYHHFFGTVLSLHLGVVVLSKSVLLWVNEGLMTVFFLLVGLEIKREMIEGELNTRSKAMLPAIAALGGMVVPALIYVGINFHDSAALRGWAIPVATDIAFSLGVLSLLGSRIPSSVKVFLTALAIFDDLAAVIIIAVFYTHHIHQLYLLFALMLSLLLLIFNRLNVSRLTPYILVSIVIWVCVLKSGVHATLTGVILAFAIPFDTSASKAKSAKSEHGRSPLKHLEHILHPWVVFFVVPVFAFANAGVSFIGLSPTHFLTPITLGITLGLFVGKQLGIWGFSMFAVRMGWAKKPRGLSSGGLYGISLIAGMGFTMSLFIGSLSFVQQAQVFSPMVRVGVLAGSFLSGLMGYLFLRYVAYK